MKKTDFFHLHLHNSRNLHQNILDEWKALWAGKKGEFWFWGKQFFKVLFQATVTLSISICIIEHKLVRNISFVGNNRFLSFTIMANHFFSYRSVWVKREQWLSMGCWQRKTSTRGKSYSPSRDQRFSTRGQPKSLPCLRKVTTLCLVGFSASSSFALLCLILPIPSTEKSSLESSSGWVPLLLALLHEYTSSQSHWKPYLSLWTDFRSLDHPMFWWDTV